MRRSPIRCGRNGAVITLAAVDWHAMRRRLIGGPNSPASHRREERGRWLAETFPDLAQMSVIDLGGRVSMWQRAPVRPKRVHVVNLEPVRTEIPEWAEVDHGDACDLPARIATSRYDLVFSNSVIEHVGGHDRRQRFADAVHQLSDAYWVQTPYRYFPVEPHWIAPGMQFLPLAARVRFARRWPLAFRRANTREEAVQAVLGIELLDRTHMRYYFPDSVLRTEKLYGIPKSVIAYRTGRN
jgi:hypothetical protein